MEERLSQQRAPVFEALKRFQRMRVVPFDVPGHKRGKERRSLPPFLGGTVHERGCKFHEAPWTTCATRFPSSRRLRSWPLRTFGAENAFFMVNGTTSAVQSMVLAACKKGEKIIRPGTSTAASSTRWCSAAPSPVYVNPEMNHKLGIALGMSVAQVEKGNFRKPIRQGGAGE